MLPTVVMGAHPRNPYKPNIQPRPNATGTPTPPMKLPGGSSGAATIDRNAASIKPPPGSLHSPGISIPRPVQRVSKGLR